MNRQLGVLISGRGSNLQAILRSIDRGALHASVAVVVSNRADAAGLATARAAGLEAVFLNPATCSSRDVYDAAIADVLRAHRVDLVCLAGFMRLVGANLIDAFPDRIVNIHPSLLPAFPGLRAQRQALEHGVRVTGATVHFVTLALDSGPIILQRTVPVLPDDTEESLSARVLAVEHQIYPEAIQLVLDGAWRLDGRRFITTRTATRIPG